MYINSIEMSGVSTKYGTFSFESNPDFLKSMYSKASSIADKLGVDIGDVLGNLPEGTKPPPEITKELGKDPIPKKYLYAGLGFAALLVAITLMKKRPQVIKTITTPKAVA